MSSLLVFVFCDEDGANHLIADMQTLQENHLITISDAAVVIRRPDSKVIIKQANDLVGAGAFGGAFWGMLIGLLFFMPWLGMTFSAVTGALTGKLTDYGLRDSFIKEIGATILPGNSALFLMVTSMTKDRVIELLSKRKAVLLDTNLSKQDEIKLREAFGAADIKK